MNYGERYYSRKSFIFHATARVSFSLLRRTLPAPSLLSPFNFVAGAQLRNDKEGTSNSSFKETGFFGVSVSSNLKAKFSSSQIDRKFRKDSVTVKFGHVTFFWNGNRSGCFNPMLEEYVEIPSDVGITFNQKPKMKALKIAKKAKRAILSRRFDQIRVNIPNGDMVGHTRDIAATKVACKVTDEVVKIVKLFKLTSSGGRIIKRGALHRSGAYKNLMNEEDVWNLKWLQVFKVLSTSALSDAPLASPKTYCLFLINFPCTAKFDIYSKSKVRIDVEKVKPYYLSLTEKVNVICMFS
ncbi:hypothetical protein ACOSQ2_014309 [Xanthoceras sorbifolium]